MGKRIDETKKALNKINAVNEIHKAAIEYKNEVLGKKFLYVFDNRYIEVIFKKSDFRHLTGVDTKLGAKDFFNYAVNGKLKASHIFFSSVHPYELHEKKVRHIQDISKLAKKESIILEDISTDKESFKFGTTDLNFTILMDLSYDDFGNPVNECYNVKSLRDEDCFKKAKNCFEVTNIFVKAYGDKKYSCLLYSDPRNKVLPKELESKIDDSIKNDFIFK